jgi:hypothetical protein
MGIGLENNPGRRRTPELRLTDCVPEPQAAPGPRKEERAKKGTFFKVFGFDETGLFGGMEFCLWRLALRMMMMKWFS